MRDAPARLFHWALVLLVAAGVVTGFVRTEWRRGVHVWAGDGLVALMAFRIVWGIFDPESSRVVSVSYPPRDLSRNPHHANGLAGAGVRGAPLPERVAP